MKNNFTDMSANRQFKDSVFKMLFSDKKNLLSLYNAINKTNYDDPDMLTINTLENAVYMGIRNDLSFILDMRLNLYEHQSTVSENLPFRFLEYTADLYSSMVERKDIYRKTRLSIPTPVFIIFYNGKEERPEREILKLSDLFTIGEVHPYLELEAIMININKGKNKELLNACKILSDYAEYTARIRNYTKTLPLDAAVMKVVDECIHEDILKDFLLKQKAEVIKMSIYEYDFDEHMDVVREEGYESGFSEGHNSGFSEGQKSGLLAGKAETAVNLSKMGMPPEQIAKAVGADISQIELWIKENLKEA